MKCTTCGRGSVIEIRMSIGEDDVLFRRCGRCDSQGWSTDEGRVTLNRVLDMARPGA